MQDIRVKSFMTTTVKTVSPATPLADAIGAMKNSPHSCMMITDEEIPVGIITERDIVRLMGDLRGNPALLSQPVRSVMSRPVVTIDANTTLLDALVIARSKNLRHLPVDNAQRKLVGLVTQSDLVTAQFRSHEMQTKILESELTNRTQEATELRRSLAELSREDPLLKISNLRAMESDIQHLDAISSRYQRPYSVALFGVDYFRGFNELYGLPSSEAALQTISSHFMETIRAADRLYRYSEDEFLILLPETLNDGAYVLGRRLMKGIAACGIPHDQHPMEVLTVSAGISSRDAWATDVLWQDVVERACEALQEARKHGPHHIACAHWDRTLTIDSLFAEATPH
ncbi:MAG TPA: GGDEF domain-containing protein [Candidatus Acidoferrales bacterium]|nr:GGDEF domain-containing protein [Candidatus Acidoferrales bacterium]